MISDSIILRGVVMHTTVNICCIAALVLGYYTVESDFDWNNYMVHAIKRENDRERQHNQQNNETVYKRIYGKRDTEYLLGRTLTFERIVVVFLVMYLIISNVYLISCLLNKTVGLSKTVYECFFTGSFFLLLIAMGMQFLSIHTYDVNYIQWEIRNGRNITQYNPKTDKDEIFYIKSHHPCTTESRLQMDAKERLQLEKRFGPHVCQSYDTKLNILIMLTIAWVFSLLIVVSVGDCSRKSYSKVLPEIVVLTEAEMDGTPKKDENENCIQGEAEEIESITTCKNSSKSSDMSINQNGNVNAEKLLAKFRSELAMTDDD